MGFSYQILRENGLDLLRWRHPSSHLEIDFEISERIAEQIGNLDDPKLIKSFEQKLDGFSEIVPVLAQHYKEYLVSKIWELKPREPEDEASSYARRNHLVKTD